MRKYAASMARFLRRTLAVLRATAGIAVIFILAAVGPLLFLAGVLFMFVAIAGNSVSLFLPAAAWPPQLRSNLLDAQACTILSGLFVAAGVFWMAVTVQERARWLRRMRLLASRVMAGSRPASRRYPDEALAVGRASVTSLTTSAGRRTRFGVRKAVHLVRAAFARSASTDTQADDPVLPGRISRSDLLKCLHFVKGVRTGHLDVYSRYCSERLIDAVGLFHNDFQPIPQHMPLLDQSEEEQQRILEEVTRFRESTRSDLVWRFAAKRITKVMYFDNLANRTLAHELVKELGRLDEVGAGPELVKVGHPPDSPTGTFAIEHELDDKNRRIKPVVENDHVLVMEANLGPKRTLESMICLLSKQQVPNIEVYVAVVFDGAEEVVNLAKFDIPQRRFHRLFRANLGLRCAERCPHCRQRLGFSVPPGFTLADNYVPW